MSVARRLMMVVIHKMKSILKIITTICALIVFTGHVGANDDSLLVEAFGPQCKHGLHQQPKNGAFSVFLFCDDALGTNIGIILTERGAGPGPTPLPETREWRRWDTTNRFWQDRKWAADIVNFAWSPSQRYLYVATSGIYGDGGFFKLDLRERTFERLIPKSNSKYSSQLADMFFTKIKKIDEQRKQILVDISLYDPKEEKVATEVILLE
jgi:hypothetical protein